MAEGWSSSVLCRYHMNGCCRDGSSCRFSHDRQTSQPSMICRYYLKGQCTYGDRCRYDHARIQQLPSNGGNNNITSPSSNNLANKIMNNPAASSASLVTESKKTSYDASRTNLGNMSVLKKRSNDLSVSDQNVIPALCADAPEFYPASVCVKSYAEVTADEDTTNVEVKKKEDPQKMNDILCPFAIMGECRYGDQCIYIHGEICEQCSHACLHPTDAEQRRQHKAECLKAHEIDMELSFAFAQSKDKICTICMDVIMEKWPEHERRFGILPNCNHIFCLSCIRTWRSTKQLENKTIRSCPQCRTPSDFVTPSNFWCENKKEKDKLIEAYKKALSLKPCKYFKQGNGECPFAGNCFYLHAYPDGQKATLPPPRPRRRRNADGDIELMQQIFLWDFMDERESRWLLQFDLDDMLDFFSDSDDSSDDNYSDFDI